MKLTLKICDNQDAKQLSVIGRQTFIDAFEHLNNPDDFYFYVDKAFSEKQILAEINTYGSRFFLVYHDDHIIGYVKINTGEAQTEPMGIDNIELERIYITKEFQNRGLGQVVLNHIIDLAKNEEYKNLWLGVWQENPGAIRFYKKKGFEIFDSHPIILEKTSKLIG